MARASVLAVKQNPFIEGARALGASSPRIVTVHVLPNIIAPLFILLAMNIPSAIAVEAGLSFLGVGVQPPTPSWGVILAEGFERVRDAPWPVISTGLALILTTLGFTLLGETLRDVIDPRLRRGARGGAGGDASRSLEVEGLEVVYRTASGRSGAPRRELHVRPARSSGSSGESGCGKSTLAAALMRLLPPNGEVTAGRIASRASDVLGADAEQLRRLRGIELAMIFQDPLSSLNPTFTIGAQMIDVRARTAAQRGRAADDARRAIAMLEQVGIPDAASGSTTTRTSSQGACGSGS